MPTTLVDVAKRCNVSTATVSRVLNNKMSLPISPETVARIRQAAKELDYRPNPMARALATGRTHTLGLYSTEITDPQFAQMLEAVEARAAARGYNVVVSGSIESVIDGGRTDGAIILGTPEKHGDAVTEKLPRVYVFGAERPLPNLVAWNDAEGIERATRHLIDLGHRSLVGLWCYGEETAPPHQKVVGFRNAVRQAGEIETHECWETADGPSAFVAQFESGRRAIARLLRQGARFTGVVARNDFLALGALRALREAGRCVPGDVSVVGYTDSIHALLADPALTSVRTPIAEAGVIAVERLLEAIESADFRFEGVTLPTELIVRGSTGPAPT